MFTCFCSHDNFHHNNMFVLCSDKIMTTDYYFAKSVFRKTSILCILNVSDPNKSFDKSVRRMCHIQQSTCWTVEDMKTFYTKFNPIWTGI